MVGGIAASRSRGAVGIPGGMTVDAFHRRRVSQADMLFESQMEYDDQPLYWHTEKINGGDTSHRQADSTLDMNVTAAVGSKVIRQSHQHFPYRAGKGQDLKATFVFGDHVPGVRYRAGYFDDDDGIFFERSPDGTLKFAIRKGGKDNTRPQHKWNRDRLDGKGVSGKTLDAAKFQILLADFQWLGGGRVRFGFDIDQPWEAHEFRHANRITTTYMRSANLPVRYEIEQVSGGTAASMQQICCSLSSEGGIQGYGLPFSACNKAAVRSIASLLPVISIRPKFTFKGRANNVFYIPQSLHAYSTVPAHWMVLYDANLTGASWQTVNAESSMEFDVSATSYSGGHEVATGYVAASALGFLGTGVDESVLGRFPMYVNYSGTDSTSITLVMNTITGGGNGGGGIDWREIR